MPKEIKNVSYIATDDVIRIIGKTFVDNASEKFYTSEGGQRKIIRNQILSALGITIVRN